LSFFLDLVLEFSERVIVLRLVLFMGKSSGAVVLVTASSNCSFCPSGPIEEEIVIIESEWFLDKAKKSTFVIEYIGLENVENHFRF